MSNNPYTNLLKVIDKRSKGINTPIFFLASVISIEPLEIQHAGVVIDRNMYINNELTNVLEIGDLVYVQPNEIFDRFYLLERMVKYE